MLLIFKKGKRGGISQCSNKFNNKYIEKKYDKNKDLLYI